LMKTREKINDFDFTKVFGEFPTEFVSRFVHKKEK
jgi:hypothetical protein